MNNPMRTFIISAALALAACTCGTSIPLHAARELSADARTVLTGAEAMRLTHQCSRRSPGPVTGQWTPSEADLDAFETSLTDILRTQLMRYPSTSAPQDYYLQYAGFVIDGRRVIYVNGVSRSTADEQRYPHSWRTNAIVPCDGGPIVFGAEFDTETHQVGNFAFNGAI